MKQTTNYLMHLPEVSDYVDIGVLDENTVKIDGELKKAETHRGEGTRHVTPAEKARWDGKAERQHTHTKSEITDFAHTHPAGDITGLDTAIAGKADKRIPAAAGNLAALDGAGNLTDAGKKPGDFAPAAHTHSKSDLTDFAHTHSAGDITAGTLPIARGGTGAGTAAAARGTLDVWSKGECLTGDTAAALGLPGTATPNDALQKLGTRSTLWKKIKEYPVAGAYTWTAPDLYQGRSYYIGALVVGGGGGGSVGLADGTSGRNSSNHALGGASGYSNAAVYLISPKSTYSVLVGKGGAGQSGPNNNAPYGQNGGTSSFNGMTANGGEGGLAVQGLVKRESYVNFILPQNIGGQNPGTFVYNGNILNGFERQWSAVPGVPFGGKNMVGNIRRPSTSGEDWGTVQCGTANGDSTSCYNPFEFKKILGAGGSLSYAVGVTPAGKYADGTGGGDASNTPPGKNATSFGCGGGATMSNPSATTQSAGAGADGAVFIYDGGAAE